MADAVASTESTTPAAPSPAKKGAGKKTKAPRAKPSHPRTSEMVNNAIKSLKERGGSSLQAIKKYVSANYKVDAEKLAPFIKKYLKGAVATGALVQTKGKGASGSFKLASAAGKQSTGSESGSAKPAKPKTAAKRSAKPKAAKSKAEKPKKTAEKKTAAAKPKKATGEKKAVATKTAAKPKTPSKAKKATKAGPTKKPKAPKPKTAKAAAKPAKKAASPKKK